MFTKFPVTRKRRNVYIYFPPTARDSMVGDQDLPKLPTVMEEKKDDTRVAQVLTENQRLKSLHRNQVSIIDELRKTILTKNQQIETLKHIPQPTPQTTTADSQIANLQNELDTVRAQQITLEKSYRTSHKLVDALRKQIESLVNAVSKGLNIPPPTVTEGTVEDTLRNLKSDLSTAVQQRTVLRTQSQDLSDQVKQLTEELDRAKKDKDFILQQEKERYVTLNHSLASAQHELNALRDRYAACVQDKDGSSTAISQLQRQLKDAQDKHDAYEKACKEQLQKLVDDARNRALDLENQNKILLDKLDNAGKDTTQTVQAIKKSDMELVDECDKKRRQVASIIPYLQRQVQIYDITSATAAGQPTFASFQQSNGHVYDTARAVTLQFKEIISCEQTIELYKSALDSYEIARSLENILVNIYEDSAGAVRVYIRLRPLASPGSEKVTAKQGKSVLYSGNLCGTPVKTYGRFFGVIPETFKNPDVYSGCKGTTVDEKTIRITGHGVAEEQGQSCCLMEDASGMCRVMNQLSDGYHVILFGYGHSGSGKTHTLLGGIDADGNVEPGIAQLTLANTAAEKVFLRSIFELSYARIDFRSKNFNSGKFVELFRKGERILKGIPQTMVQNEQPSFAEAIAASQLGIPDLDRVPIDAKDLYNLRQVLDAYRADLGRIKATPNNPQSSRSHLFITLEFQFKGGIKGYLTLIDMGGRESSLEVLEMFLEKPADRNWQMTSLLMNDPKLYPAYLRPHRFTPRDPSISWLYDDARYRTDLKYAQTVNLYVKKLNEISGNLDNVVDVVKESVFINETINQLILFFRMKQEPTREANSFGMKEVRFPLDDRKNTYNPSKFIAGIPTPGTDKMGMMRILSILSVLFGKPSKFVMICNVRQEAAPEKFCLSTRETLEFAYSIRST